MNLASSEHASRKQWDLPGVIWRSDFLYLYRLKPFYSRDIVFLIMTVRWSIAVFYSLLPKLKFRPTFATQIISNWGDHSICQHLIRFDRVNCFFTKFKGFVKQWVTLTSPYRFFLPKWRGSIVSPNILLHFPSFSFFFFFLVHVLDKSSIVLEQFQLFHRLRYKIEQLARFVHNRVAFVRRIV